MKLDFPSFYNFSTFLGRAGIYLEDLYVRLECRGKGYGKAILKQLAAIAAERGCGRLDGGVLTRTSRVLISICRWAPSRRLTRRVYRIAGETLTQLAKPDPHPVD